MQRGRPERCVAIVFRGPSCDVAVIDCLDLTRVRMTRPHERAAFAGLAPATELDGVVRNRRPEIGAPRGLAAIAAHARIGQDVDAPVTDLDGQGVRVGMRGDTEVPVRPAVAPAPDLVSSAGPQQRHSRVSEP